MKLSTLSVGARFVAFAFIASAVVGCGGDKKNTTDGKGGATVATTMPKTYKGQAGPGPSVPAELGGSGFEKIAADSGWQTGTITEDQFKYIADPNAKKGGEIRFAEQEYPATFRPYGKDGNTTTIALITAMVYEPLITTNPLTLEFLPVLASHWRVDPDGQTYWFRIDPNARFSDGYPVTSADVIATHKLLLDTGIADPFANDFYGKYETPVAISKYIFKVRSKNKEWKNMLYFGGTQILPAHVLDTMSGAKFLQNFQYEMLPGSGPYVVLPADVKKQKSVTLTRLADWWQKDLPINKGQYNIDKIKLLTIEDENLRYEKFRNGELDFYFVSRAQWWHTKFDYDEIKSGKVQKRKIYTDDPQGVSGFAFNTRRAPFNDPKVREAFILLFNRQEIIEKLLYNEYIISDSYFPNSVYENKNNAKYRYNTERAAQLLAEAGYTARNADGVLVKDGKAFEIELPISKGSEHIMSPTQEGLKKAGIKLNIRTVDWAQQLKLQDERNFDLVYINYTGLLYPNPTGSFHSRMADKNNTNNITGFKNPRADELIDRELVTYDQGERVKILQELDSILMDSKSYALAWYAPFQRLAYWNYVKQPNFYLTKTGDWRSLLALWWIDKDGATPTPGQPEVKFWPEYNKSNPPKYASYTAGTQASKPAAGGGDTSAKPSVK